jgi:PAS domain S-box-containing protein
MPTSLRDAIERLRPPGHVCCVYESQEEQFASVIPFIRIGLERGEKCVYVADDEQRLEPVRAALSGAGIQVDHAIRSGALIVTTHDWTYLRSSDFEPGKVDTFWREQMKEARRSGYTGLRIAGETGWVKRGAPGIDRWIEYESLVTKMLAEIGCLALCQYDRRRCSPELLLNVIRTHPLVVYRGMICDNFYFVPPEEFLVRDGPEREVKRLLHNVSERERTERELMLFRTLIDRSNDAIEVFEPQTLRILDINEKACLDLGYTRKELLSLTAFDIDPTLDQSSVARIRKELQKSGSVIRESVHRRKDGSTFPVEVNLKHVQLDQGYRVAVVRDITERNHAEQRLRKSESLLAQAEQLANLGSWELDLKTDTLVWSEQIYRMLNLSPQGVNEKADRFWQMVPLDDRERAQRENRSAIANRCPVEYELRCVLPDGRVRTIQARAVPSYDETGQPLRLVGMAQDITERKEAEEMLRKSESLLTQAEQLANLGSWEMDLRTGTLTWSKQMYRMLGLDPEKTFLSRDSFWQMVYPDDRERGQRDRNQAVAEHRPIDNILRCLHADGSLRIVHVCAVPVYDEAGVPLRLMGMSQDITEQKQAEEALRRLSQQLLRTRDAERRQMARELHETAGQSLAALKMMLGRLRDVLSEDDEAARDLVAASVQLAEDAVREVRVVSYLMHPPMLDEGGLGLALRWYARGFADRSGIQAEIEVADDFGRYPQEIETTIFRVVQEALTNVHRYSGSQTVTIRLAREEGQIRAEVRDEGSGLALPPPAPGRDVPPLGVGIAGMRERVMQLQGVFEIESVPGRGTTVRAILPIPHKDASSTAVREPPNELKTATEPQKSREKEKAADV